MASCHHEALLRRFAFFILLIGLSKAFDCCGGHVCNDNWDQYDSATGNCCMLPKGGKMMEQTAVGSCSCPSLQECDAGPKKTEPAPPPPPPPEYAPKASSFPPQEPSEPVYTPRRVEKKYVDPNSPIEYVLLGCCAMLVFMMAVVMCVGLWRVGQGYDRLSSTLEKMPLRQETPQIYGPYQTHNQPNMHLTAGTFSTGARSDMKNVSINGPQNPAYFHQSYQNRDLMEMIRYLNQYHQLQQGQQRNPHALATQGAATNSEHERNEMSEREKEAGRKDEENMRQAANDGPHDEVPGGITAF